MLPIRDLCGTAFCVLLSVVFYENKNNNPANHNAALHLMPSMNAVFAFRWRHCCGTLTGRWFHGCGKEPPLLWIVNIRVTARYTRGPTGSLLVSTKRTINVWNKLSEECVHASSVNMFKNRIYKYLVKAGYT